MAARDDRAYVAAMAAGSKVTVLIAHGNPLLSLGLEAAFRGSEGFEVVLGDDLPARTVEVIVADFDNGVNLAPALAAPVMIVSHEDGESNVRHALEAGVRGYLLQGSSIEAIVEGARIIVSGGIVIDPFVTSKMLSSLNAERLTKRELEVLSLLMRGLTDKQIASRLGSAVETIKCHAKQLRKKLKAGSRTEAILIAQRRGLLPGENIRLPRNPETHRRSADTSM